MRRTKVKKAALMIMVIASEDTKTEYCDQVQCLMIKVILCTNDQRRKTCWLLRTIVECFLIGALIWIWSFADQHILRYICTNICLKEIKKSRLLLTTRLTCFRVSLCVGVCVCLLAFLFSLILPSIRWRTFTLYSRSQTLRYGRILASDGFPNIPCIDAFCPTCQSQNAVVLGKVGSWQTALWLVGVFRSPEFREWNGLHKVFWRVGL